VHIATLRGEGRAGDPCRKDGPYKSVTGCLTTAPKMTSESARACSRPGVSSCVAPRRTLRGRGSYFCEALLW
jgi:hypothetical protein